MRGEAACRNCGRPGERAPLFTPERQTTLCGSCGGWSFEGPIDSTAGELYDESYFNGGEYFNYEESAPIHRRNFERKLRILKSRGLLPDGEIRALELGCATGEFGALLKPSIAPSHPPVRYLGLEVSDYCRRAAETRGLEVYSPFDPSATEAVRRLKPNLIVAWDVWEHLPDPIATFESHLALADPEVVMALTTVDTSAWMPRFRKDRWRQFHPPTHLNYPSRESFRMFFQDRGFEVEYHQSFGYVRALSEYLRPLSRIFLRTELRWKWTFHVPLYLNLHDTQMVVASRRGIAKGGRAT